MYGTTFILLVDPVSARNLLLTAGRAPPQPPRPRRTARGTSLRCRRSRIDRGSSPRRSDRHYQRGRPTRCGQQKFIIHHVFRNPLTINAILAACAAADKTIIMLNTPHPDSRSCFPPERITRYATMPMDSRTTASDIKKPTLRHMEQKYRSSPWQSSYCGKGSQVPVNDEQRRWRPYE